MLFTQGMSQREFNVDGLDLFGNGSDLLFSSPLRDTVTVEKLFLTGTMLFIGIHTWSSKSWCGHHL